MVGPPLIGASARQYTRRIVSSRTAPKSKLVLLAVVAAVVAAMCVGQERCVVPATEGHFGAPCATDGEEAGAWMSLTIAAHELIYTADHGGGRARLHHLAWFVDTREELLRAADLFLDADVPIEAAPSKHAVAQGMFLYVYEPGGTGPPAPRNGPPPTLRPRWPR